MRIIAANKFYFLKGGAERVMFETNELLSACGHEVIPFAMHDKRNRESTWAKYFVSEVHTASPRLDWQGLRTAARVLYSFEARRKFAALLDAAKPDLVHAHNIYHQISPSILPQAKKRGVPVVMTVHDYNLISPNYSLFHDGRIWEPKGPGDYGDALARRVVKGSFAATALELAAMRLHRALGLYADTVSTYIAPSRFMQATLVRFGIPPERVTQVPNFIEAAKWRATPAGKGEYALFAGRLAEGKGVDTLLTAAKRAPEVPVVIAGTGPLDHELHARATKEGLRNVRFVGHKSGRELEGLYAKARFVVIPSEWYEVFGMVALEAYASGKPVVASQIGGLAEIVRDGETGVQVSAGDADDLAAQMKAMWSDPSVCTKFGAAGRAWVEEDFSPARYYERLMDVYRDARRAS